ncbi:hypothetical protein [Nocardioides sp. Leaf374]|uniref:hypothetical protein n=1 Tax=Nocardioides sp. Leaf374 TaxID=2876560 RepID=UPI001E409A05|nr:hypothetical protein [Nocardioides sp. Leaf374]
MFVRLTETISVNAEHVTALQQVPKPPGTPTSPELTAICLSSGHILRLEVPYAKALDLLSMATVR